MTQQNHLIPQVEDRSFGLYSFLLYVLDFGLLNVAFYALNYWKRGTFDLSSMYSRLLLIFYVIWIFVSLLTRKLNIRAYGGYWEGIELFIRSGLYGAYCAAFIVVMFELSDLSRLHALGTWALLAIQEAVIFTIFYAVAGKYRKSMVGDLGSSVGDLGGEQAHFSRVLLVFDFVLVGISFFVMNYLKRGNLYFLPHYEKLFLIIYGLWFVTSLATRKYAKRAYPNYYHALWPWIKSAVLMVAVMSIVVFGIRIFYFSRAQVFGTLLVLFILEILFVGLYFIFNKYNKASRDIESVDEVKAVLRQRRLPGDAGLEEMRRFLMMPVGRYLETEVFNENSDVFEFLDRSFHLEEIVRSETVVLNTNDTIRPGLMIGWPLCLFINLRKINDIRWLNRYCLNVYESLNIGGYFFGKAHTINTHKKWIYRKYPRQIANGIYFADFCVNRIFPKLPVTKQVYFALTRGKGRVLSKAEILGRLCFCGFDIVAEKEIDGSFFFIGCKAKTSSVERNPSYGPLVGFRRVGANNELIRTFKFRTMHPYSEFLQDYVYSKKGLRDGGKIAEDFRITEWGKWMRKLWLDELPMLYNWLRGDLKLFGVRPLSPHYLSLYPKDLQGLRKEVKPGLVPPFYADMPKTFDEICESERSYIKKFLDRPVATQWVYFWKAFWNIVFKGARSH